jgi:exopolyphosphatase / guanosine-5'-triphosphate,3'-diphosphate pyrophosphatase
MPRYAAVDIGSNSVRMLAAEVVPGQPWVTLAADREVTRIGASVFETGTISREAMENVGLVLRRFAETLSKLDVVAVRAVATSAVRDASNGAEFVERATADLGIPVEIVSGQEEARLIYMGVQARWPQRDGRFLIIDVGGGSAEFIVGEDGDLVEGVSRPLGAVRLTEAFLRTDPPDAASLHRLTQFIDEKFTPVRKRLQGNKFDRVIATSATAAAIVSAVNHVERSERDQADRLGARTSQIRKLCRQLAGSDLAMRRRINGIGPRRAEIVVAGVAVFLRVMEELGLKKLNYSVAGVRDGIIADLSARGVGRELTRLSRQQLGVVEEMCRRYQVNMKYARHVTGLVTELYDGLQPLHRLPPEMGKLLQAAGYLHDVGHFVGGTGHHKHSAYLVANSDLPGFTDVERKLIALLCRFHRKSMPQQRHDSFRGLPADQRRAILLLTPLLRLAVALNTSQQQRVEEIHCQVTSQSALIRVDADGDCGLELWAAGRVADIFRQVYDVPLLIEGLR